MDSSLMGNEKAEGIEHLKDVLGIRNDRELAETLGMDYELVRNVKKNRSEAGWDQLKRLASEKLGREWPGESLPIPVNVPSVKVRLVGSASAGSGTDGNLEEGYVYVPTRYCAPDTVAWQAEGDSMMPWIQPGDIILARQHKEPRYGYAMLVRGRDGNCMVKKIGFDGGKTVLVSINHAYPKVPAEVEYLGYVTGIYHLIGTYERSESDMSGLRPPEF
jgi:phage repressor protein C with HTH and peptisase S24 domain